MTHRSTAPISDHVWADYRCYLLMVEEANAEQRVELGDVYTHGMTFHEWLASQPQGYRDYHRC